MFINFFFSSLLLSSLELSDTKVYEPQMRARLGTAAHFCEAVVIKLYDPAPIRPPADYLSLQSCV